MGREPLARWSCLLSGVAFAASAGACGSYDPDAVRLKPELRINEVVADNEGVWIDELGETDDYVELYNGSPRTLRLSDYLLIDRSGEHSLPDLLLASGATRLLWADGEPEQGETHLPFKLSSAGEHLALVRKDSGEEVDRVQMPPLGEHEAYQRQPNGDGDFSVCGWATPGRENGRRCGPGPPPPPPGDLTFAPYTWPDVWPPTVAPLAITELALRPADFVELENTSGRALDLSDFELRVATNRVGVPFPGATDGVAVALPDRRLPHGDRIVVGLDRAALAPLEPELFEDAVVSVFERDGAFVDRLDFSSYPEGAVLARAEPASTFHFCKNASPGSSNEGCDELESRPVSDHERRLLTPGDHHELAKTRGGVGIEGVGFIVDMQSDDAVLFLNSADWDLHYTFVRERILMEPHLDRCDRVQASLFLNGWIAFSEEHYFRVDTRRYLLGMLQRHAGTELSTLEFAAGDAISAEQMTRAFHRVMEHVPDPKSWAIRPQTQDQIDRIRTIEGTLPIVGPNAPFIGLTFQALTPGVAFGTLRFVPSKEIDTTPLGPRDIVVTDEVPNDIPLIGGLVTEAFQTPLAHVNILSRGRNTPNMALKNARHDPRLQPYFDKLVKLEVIGTEFHVSDADNAEALAFWESRLPDELLVPRLDTSLRGVVPLDTKGLADIPSIGGKAAQLAELGRVPLCDGNVSTPHLPFAIPVVHSLEHYEKSGARAFLERLRADPKFAAEPLSRAAGLARLREVITRYPMDRALLAEVKAAIDERFPGVPVRFRSSSNTEDLPGFSGAGLYTSEGVDAEDLPGGVEDAVRSVWSSLYERRGYEEREFQGVDQSTVAMAVLVHPAFHSERVNGVAISRDILQPTRADRYTINSQLGEALVTNPAPGIESELITYSLFNAPTEYHSHSTFSPTRPLTTNAELSFLRCNLYNIHQYFRPLLDPLQENPWFAMDIEWKLMGPERALVIKQARSYSFGAETREGWCDF
jgi:hypothetical protein